MTLAEAARAALEDLGRASTVQEIHAGIVARELFEFKAKDPIGVLSKAIRKKCIGSPSLKGEAIFRRDDGRYRLA